jgi:dolichol kinase
MQEIKTKLRLKDFLKELARKVIHVSFCITALCLIKLNIPILKLLFLPLAILGFIISEKIDFFGKNISFGPKRKWGGIFLAVGLSLVIFSPVAYSIKKFAILTLGIADVAAALVGKSLPIRRYKLVETSKSIGGSLAFILGLGLAWYLSFGSSLLFSWQSLLAAVILVNLELFNWRGIDNVTMPVVCLILGSTFGL